MCIKTVTLPDKHKIFINICQSTSVPPPPALSRDELVELLESEDPGGYRVPMSLGEPHTELDNSECVSLQGSEYIILEGLLFRFSHLADALIQSDLQ